MKNIACIFILAVLHTTSYLCANPFSAKIKKQIRQTPQDSVQKILFKGYAVIGEKHFGLVQIGDADFEVKDGDLVKGIRIRKVTSSRLEYSVNNQSRYILLNSK